MNMKSKFQKKKKKRWKSCPVILYFIEKKEINIRKSFKNFIILKDLSFIFIEYS